VPTWLTCCLRGVADAAMQQIVPAPQLLLGTHPHSKRTHLCQGYHACLQTCSDASSAYNTMPNAQLMLVTTVETYEASIQRSSASLLRSRASCSASQEAAAEAGQQR